MKLASQFLWVTGYERDNLFPLAKNPGWGSVIKLTFSDVHILKFKTPVSTILHCLHVISAFYLNLLLNIKSHLGR